MRDSCGVAACGKYATWKYIAGVIQKNNVDFIVT